MKSKCEQCGCRFDMEENMYICPKCGHYHSQTGRINDPASPRQGPKTAPQEAQTQQKQAVLRKRNDRAQGKQRRSDFFDAQSDPREKNRTQQILCVLILLCMILFPIFYHNWTAARADTVYQAQKVRQVPEKNAQLGQPMKLEPLTVTVTGIAPFRFEGIAAPEGWKYIRADFKAQRSEESSWNDNTEIFLKYDEVYYRALSAYSLAEDDTLQTSLEDAGLETSASYGESGFWVFLVPEGAADCTLRISLLEQQDQEDSYSLYTPSLVYYLNFTVKEGESDA